MMLPSVIQAGIAMNIEHSGYSSNTQGILSAHLTGLNTHTLAAIPDIATVYQTLQSLSEHTATLHWVFLKYVSSCQRQSISYQN